MKLYYVETKSYFVDSLGNDRQIADGGTMPILYHSADKAIARAEFVIKLWIDTFNYRLAISNENMPCKNFGCIYGARLMDDIVGTRYEIRVYEVETIN